MASDSVSNGAGLRCFGPGWNRLESPRPGTELPSNLTRVTSGGLVPGPDINQRFIGRV